VPCGVVMMYAFHFFKDKGNACYQNILIKILAKLHLALKIPDFLTD
jgi:hypothetical protein